MMRFKGGWYHYVRQNDSLLHLAAWYYGKHEGWTVIFWANEDIYGDNVALIPVGTRIFVPALETKDVIFPYRGRSIYTDAFQEIVPPAPIQPSPCDFTVIPNPDTAWTLLYRADDDSYVYSGRGGMDYAVETLALEDSTTLSNSMGSTTEDLTGDEAAIEYTATHKGLPYRKSFSDEEYQYIGNIFKKIATIYYGHHYYYHELVKYNDTKEETPVTYNQNIKLFSRAKRYDCETARSWRNKLGYS